MPARVHCPTCDTALTAPDELLGSTVRCEACGQTFTAKAPASRRRLEEYDDRPPRRPRFEDDDDDFDRPRDRRRVRPRRRTAAAPFVFAALLFVGLVGGIGGLFWYFTTKLKNATPPVPAFAGPQLQPWQPPVAAGGPGFGDPQPIGPQQPQPPAGQRVTLSNPRWSGPFNDFEVDYTFNGGRPVGGLYSLVFRSPDGGTGSATLHGIFNASGTARIRVMGMFGRGGRRAGPIEMWMVEGPVMPGPNGPDGGAAISNRVTLN